MERGHLFYRGGGDQRRKGLLPALLKILLPVLLVGGVSVLLAYLNSNGMLRAFLDRQSVFGMILVVLVVNAIGFSFVYMLSAVWKAVKRDLGHDED
jgi:ABC-type uncharacterized transport system YnjBCD permease subunit